MTSVSKPTYSPPPFATATANTTHLLWCDRWIEVTRHWAMGEWCWRFKTGRDAADWLLW